MAGLTLAFILMWGNSLMWFFASERTNANIRSVAVYCEYTKQRGWMEGRRSRSRLKKTHPAQQRSCANEIVPVDLSEQGYDKTEQFTRVSVNFTIASEVITGELDFPLSRFEELQERAAAGKALAIDYRDDTIKSAARVNSLAVLSTLLLIIWFGLLLFFGLRSRIHVRAHARLMELLGVGRPTFAIPNAGRAATGISQTKSLTSRLLNIIAWLIRIILGATVIIWLWLEWEGLYWTKVEAEVTSLTARCTYSSHSLKQLLSDQKKINNAHQAARQRPKPFLFNQHDCSEREVAIGMARRDYGIAEMDYIARIRFPTADGRMLGTCPTLLPETTSRVAASLPGPTTIYIKYSLAGGAKEVTRLRQLSFKYGLAALLGLLLDFTILGAIRRLLWAKLRDIFAKPNPSGAFARRKI